MDWSLYTAILGGCLLAAILLAAYGIRWWSDYRLRRWLEQNERELREVLAQLDPRYGALTAVEDKIVNIQEHRDVDPIFIARRKAEALSLGYRDGIHRGR